MWKRAGASSTAGRPVKARDILLKRVKEEFPRAAAYAAEFRA
jgi:hypothetical protein